MVSILLDEKWDPNCLEMKPLLVEYDVQILTGFHIFTSKIVRDSNVTGVFAVVVEVISPYTWC